MMRNATLLRGVLFLDAAVFLLAALFNMGVRIPLGFADLGFSDPVWQAGIGETVIGVTLLAAGLTARARLAWLGFWLSALGIAIGLSSQRVQGAARDLHVAMVPLAIVLLVLLLAGRRQPSATRAGG